MSKISRKKFEEYLNRQGLEKTRKEFSINGEVRDKYFPNKFGKMLRKLDNIQFDVLYNEYNREHSKRYL